MQINKIEIYKKNTNGYWSNFLVWDRILAAVFCLLTFPVVIFTFYNISDSGLWFFSLQYLTNQGNLIFWSFLLLYAFANNRRIFNRNYFLICALSYITFVFLGFNILLLPNMVKNSEFTLPRNWVETVWYHMFSPILDITFGSLVIAKVKNIEPGYRIVGFGYIYIVYQIIYFCILPFASAAIRLWNKIANFKILGLTLTNNDVGSVSTFLPFTYSTSSQVYARSKGSVMSLANQLLQKYTGNKTNLANDMIKNWFTVGDKSFVAYQNGHLVVISSPNSFQLATIYNNLGLNYDAIRSISDGQQPIYFHDNVYSVYGEITNTNPLVNIYSINSVNNSSSLNKLYHNLLSGHFNPYENNMYVDNPGSYYLFFVIAGAAFVYFLLLSFWWWISKIGLKRQKRNFVK